ncbi:uncharacterized protein C2845_PM07G23640 [Panicum miliaceum]|uniref:Uncharacterized protein n=1 Tax=Panicum miliaceum TaxID=4540 RepID=A0A3L6STF9_PANMI|nr:uncharacterized protein C2845_PM07G23640 [Panicum miliaceum]
MRADRAMGERGGDQRRINLGAPLRSARRGDAPPRYKPDLKSGPVRHPGAVPFVWEQRPGQPKSVRTRRAAPPTPPREEVGGGGGTPYHDALADLDLQALHGAADRGSRAAPASHEVVAVEARKQEAVSVAAVLRKPHGDGEEEEERFSDALDTLSRTESFAMNCSVSGLSGAVDSGPGAGPEARGLMMDRFLPAAQAVAVGSPQYTFRKAGGTSNSGCDHAHARAAAAKASAGSGDDRMRRAPVQLPYQHLPPNYLSCAYPRCEEHEEEDEEDDDDYDVHSTRGFSAKGCGLLPGLCVKTSLLLLNPMPAMKRSKAQGRGRGRQFPSKGRGQMAQSPLARSSQNKQLGCDSNGQSWEDVYKHKLEQKYLGQGEDGRSKVTSESNHLTFWSDSQTGDGSSPYHPSIAGGMSPYRNYAVMSPSSKANVSSRIGDRDDKESRSNGSGSLGRDHDRTSLVGSDHSSFKGSSSMSSGPDVAGHEDSMDHHGDTDSETCHLGVLVDTRAALNANMCDSQPGGQQIVGKNSIVKDQVNDPLTEKISEVREPTFPLDDRKDLTHDANQEVPSHLEDNNVTRKEIIPLQSLLPLPVPKSPSESWLSRTLPSVTNKPPPPSFLGIQVHSKKQAPWAAVHPKENDHKPSRPRQIRFADVRLNFPLFCMSCVISLCFSYLSTHHEAIVHIFVCISCLGGRKANFNGFGDMMSSLKTNIYPFMTLMPWGPTGSYTSPALNGS